MYQTQGNQMMPQQQQMGGGGMMPQQQNAGMMGNPFQQVNHSLVDMFTTCTVKVSRSQRLTQMHALRTHVHVVAQKCCSTLKTMS